MRSLVLIFSAYPDVAVCSCRQEGSEPGQPSQAVGGVNLFYHHDHHHGTAASHLPPSPSSLLKSWHA